MKNATPAQKQLGFRIHAIAFVPTLVVLAIVNRLTGPPYWVLWVLLGWGRRPVLPLVLRARPRRGHERDVMTRPPVVTMRGIFVFIRGDTM